MNITEKSKLIQAWQKSAEEDLLTADDLFKIGRYSGALFYCHLALEKILKALYVKINDTYPAPIHRLAKLAKDNRISLSDEQINYLNEITTFNVEARYDIFKEKLYKKATKQFTQKYLDVTHDLFVYFSELL